MNKDEKILDELLGKLGLDTSVETKESVLNLSYGLEGVASQVWRAKDKSAKDNKNNVWTIEMTDVVKQEVVLRMNGEEVDRFILSYSNSMKTAYFKKTPVTNKRFR